MPDDHPKTPYQKLKERFAHLSRLSGAEMILHHDAQVAMAPGSEDDRSEQIQTLNFAAHQLIIKEKVGLWLDQAEEKRGNLSPEDDGNLFLMRRKWSEYNSLSPELAQQKARIEALGGTLHQRHKASGNWEEMLGWYEQAFQVMREVGLARQQADPNFSSPYEALLDHFNPGMKDATIDREFTQLEQYLPKLILDIRQKQAQEPPPTPLKGRFSREQQDDLCRRIDKAIGFDFKRGNLYLTEAHPSTMGSADDVRITSQCDEMNFLSAVAATTHETGHALYQQGLPPGWRYQPAGDNMGMSMHESQSRIMEVVACQTPEFFQFLETQARDVFGLREYPALDAKNLEKLVCQVTPSFIRVHADEATYSAHVILHYRLEKALVDGALEVVDIPAAWNEGMQLLLGITPTDPSVGHMQDIHWPSGWAGYFPAYTRGDMGAAQFFAAACRERPDLQDELANGNFRPLTDWLREKVHCLGALLTPEELFIAATGEDLNAKYHLDHLSMRYLGRSFISNPDVETPSDKRKMNPSQS